MNKKRMTAHNVIVSAVLALAMLTPILFLSQLAQCQTRATGNLNTGNVKHDVNRLQVFPTANNDNTNSFTIFDKTGTNYFRIAPTNNAQLQYRVGGLLYTGLTATITFTAGTNVAANGGSNTLTFKNGILVGGGL